MTITIMPMKKELTDSAVLLRLAYTGMRRLELPVEKILMRAGVNLSQVESNARTPLNAQGAFWEALESVSGDDCIGLHLGEHMPLYRGQVMEYLFTSSSSFGAGLERALAYQRIVSDALHAELKKEEGQCYLANIEAHATNDDATLRHFSECFLVGIVRFFRFITEGQFEPLHIDLNYEQGATAEEYRRVFGCDVSLGEEESRLYFDEKVLSFQMWQAEPEVLRLHEQLAIEKLQKLARFDLVNEVRQVIGENLETGEVSLELVAEQIGVPTRRLRAQLSDAETSFHQILSNYRCRLAKRLLAHTDESVERIVYLTGFSEPSTFYRAFKRWTNETPVQYRKRKSQQEDLN